jgi:hypothetical protein
VNAILENQRTYYQSILFKFEKDWQIPKSWSDQFLCETTSEEGICSLTYCKRFIEIFIALESFEAFKGNPKKVT